MKDASVVTQTPSAPSPPKSRRRPPTRMSSRASPSASRCSPPTSPRRCSSSPASSPSPARRRKSCRAATRRCESSSATSVRAQWAGSDELCVGSTSRRRPAAPSPPRPRCRGAARHVRETEKQDERDATKRTQKTTTPIGKTAARDLREESADPPAPGAGEELHYVIEGNCPLACIRMIAEQMRRADERRTRPRGRPAAGASPTAGARA